MVIYNSCIKNYVCMLIQQAARDGLLDIVQAHLRSGVVMIDDIDEDSLTALHHAARYNRVDVMQALLDANAGIAIVVIYNIVMQYSIIVIKK